MREPILVMGYGNPGRGDDGLGPALIAELSKLGLPGIALESAYQLGIEDAEKVAQHEVVIFADAGSDSKAPFELRTLQASGDPAFTTHLLEPAAVVALAQELFGARTEGYLLAIRGYEFGEFSQELSYAAQVNLAQTVSFFRAFIKSFSGFLAARELDAAHIGK